MEALSLHIRNILLNCRV